MRESGTLLSVLTRTTGGKDYLGFWYQKIARATRATVMIQRMMSFVRFFSLGSAISEVQHT